MLPTGSTDYWGNCGPFTAIDCFVSPAKPYHIWGNGSWMSPMVRVLQLPQSSHPSLPICFLFPYFQWCMKKPCAITPAWIFVRLNEKQRSFWASLILATWFPTAPQRSWDFGTWCFVPFISRRHTNPANKVSDTSQTSWETLFIMVCLWSNNNSSCGEQSCFHPYISFWGFLTQKKQCYFFL